jgi:tetratricopeptide (TPR) repeat protein
MASDHLDEALGLARRAVLLGDAPEAHLVLAGVLEQNGKIDEALAEYKLARKPPVMEAATLGHARMLVRTGATKDALVELEALAKSGSSRGDALALMGDAYSDLQQQDKALRSYEEAVRLEPQAGDLSFRLGRALLDASKREPGIAALERAIRLGEPKASWLPDSYLLLGDAHRGHENSLAIRSYTKYLEIAPASAPMRAEATKQISLLGGTPPATP